MKGLLAWIREGRQLRIDSERTRQEIADLLAELRTLPPYSWADTEQRLRDRHRRPS